MLTGHNDTLFYAGKFCEGTKFDKISMNFKILLHIPQIDRVLPRNFRIDWTENPNISDRKSIQHLK